MTRNAEKGFPKTLPVWGTIREAFEFGWQKRHILRFWIFVGAIFGGLANLVGFFISQGREELESTLVFGLEYFGITFLAFLPSTLVWVVLAVFCHRSILLFPLEKDFSLSFVFSSREWKFFAWVILVYIITIICLIPGSMTAGILLLELDEVCTGSPWIKKALEISLFYGLFLFPLYYLAGRWSLVFPLIAIDDSPSLRWSWRMTKGNGWRMCGLVSLIPLTVWCLFEIYYFFGLSVYSYIDSFLYYFFLLLLTPVEVAIVSIAFRELIGWVPPSPDSENASVL